MADDFAKQESSCFQTVCRSVGGSICLSYVAHCACILAWRRSPCISPPRAGTGYPTRRFETPVGIQISLPRPMQRCGSRPVTSKLILWRRPRRPTCRKMVRALVDEQDACVGRRPNPSEWLISHIGRARSQFCRLRALAGAVVVGSVCGHRRNFLPYLLHRFNALPRASAGIGPPRRTPGKYEATVAELLQRAAKLPTYPGRAWVCPGGLDQVGLERMSWRSWL